MNGTDSIYERRHPVRCDVCNREMVFANMVRASRGGKNIYVKYICPTRGGESGCGATTWISFDKVA
jgi:hypothetical protein